MPGPDRSEWIAVPKGSPFTPAHLPYGVGRPGDEPFRVVAAVGDHALDLDVLQRAGALDGCGAPAGVFAAASLNAFMATGPAVWAAVRDRLQAIVAGEPRPGALLAQAQLTLTLPFDVADYVDFYTSEQHAATMGRMLRPGTPPLPDAFAHVPLGYHGRSATVVVSGTPVRRPAGVVDASNRRVPSAKLDVEMELGYVVGMPNDGAPIAVDRAAGHLFGAVLVNDWSARDIQAFESRPLGPFLGKSFATSISAWVTPMAALEACRVDGPTQDPPPPAHLQAPQPRALDIVVTLSVNGAAVARAQARQLRWSPEQLLAHLTSNGAAVRTGDLFATGTISGPGQRDGGSLMELTVDGTAPLTLPDGSALGFLRDGDTVEIAAACRSGGGRAFAMAPVTAAVVPSPADDRPADDGRLGAASS